MGRKPATPAPPTSDLKVLAEKMLLELVEAVGAFDSLTAVVMLPWYDHWFQYLEAHEIDDIVIRVREQTKESGR